jgi:hypothetical protein
MKHTSIIKVLMFTIVSLCFAFSSAAQGSCAPFVQQALGMAGSSCGTVPLNAACYGFYQVNATASTPITFAQPADIVDLAMLQNLTTFGYNPGANTWGIAVLRLQANIPNTLPGQAVSMVLLGDAALANGTAGSSAFVVTTGIGQPSCQQIPPASITVQGPQNLHVNLNVNGADIGFGSSVNIRQTSEDEMQIATLDGRVTIDDEVIIPVGFKRTAELGDDGLFVEDTWSEPEILTEDDIAEFELLEQMPEEMFGYPIDAPSEEEIAYLEALGFDLVAAMDPYLLDTLIADFQLGGIYPEDLAGTTLDDLFGYVLANLDYFEPDEAFLAAMAASFNMDAILLEDLASYYDLDMGLINAIQNQDFEAMFDADMFPTSDTVGSEISPGEDTGGGDSTGDSGSSETIVEPPAEPPQEPPADSGSEAPPEPPADTGGGGEGGDDGGGDGG